VVKLNVISQIAMSWLENDRKHELQKATNITVMIAVE